MKARLGELQARLDNHERQRIQQAAHRTGDALNSVPVCDGHLDQNAALMSSLGSMNNLNGVGSTLSMQRGVDMSPLPLTHEERRQSTMPILRTDSAQERGLEESEPNFYSQSAQYLHTPPNSHPSPQAPNGLPSPPGRPDHEQSSMLDCLRFQSQLVNRLSTVEHDAPCTRQTQYGSPVSSLPQGVFHDASESVRMFSCC